MTTFQQLCDGEVNYVCDRRGLMRIQNTDSKDGAKDKLVIKVNETLHDIENATGRKIRKFYIGKTYIKKGKEEDIISSQEPETWTIGGISGRWNHHRDMDYGKDGLVVITVIQNDEVPQGYNKPLKYTVNQYETLSNEQAYILELEEMLIHHYQEEGYMGKKCANSSGRQTHPVGKIVKNEVPRRGYVIYVAFTLNPSRVPGLVRNAEHLRQIPQNELETVKNNLVSKINNEKFFNDMQVAGEPKRAMENFYIGTTYGSQIQDPKGVLLPIEPENPNTWTKDQLEIMWRYHRRRYYGRDGLVVITAIQEQEEQVPQGPNNLLNAEAYTLELASRLVQYYTQPRQQQDQQEYSGKCVNGVVYDEDIPSGHPVGKVPPDNRSRCYVIYLAFRLRDPANTKNPQHDPVGTGGGGGGHGDSQAGQSTMQLSVVSDNKKNKHKKTASASSKTAGSTGK